MAYPVTRHALNPMEDNFLYLLCGIDSLDLGLYVNWGANWKRRLLQLNKIKQKAQQKDGLVVKITSSRTCIFKPGGKGQNYRFHLQFNEYQLFIGKAARAESSPNVYLSINSHAIWLQGLETVLSLLAADLQTIGSGSIQHIKPSKLDLCADFLIPGGLSLDFLLAHKVTNNKKSNMYLGDDEVETYYVGDVAAPIKLRIYNKGIEVHLKGGQKLWFLKFWELESSENVWRVELQLRRTALKEFEINSLEELHDKMGGIWNYLTKKWFSLRLPDNEKTERRTVHTYWEKIQNCAEMFGPQMELKRNLSASGTASPEWHLSHIDGCLSSFAALLGITNRDDALHELQNRLTRRNNATDFETACIKKAIHRGTMSEGAGQ